MWSINSEANGYGRFICRLVSPHIRNGNLVEELRPVQRSPYKSISIFNPAPEKEAQFASSNYFRNGDRNTEYLSTLRSMRTEKYRKWVPASDDRQPIFTQVGVVIICGRFAREDFPICLVTKRVGRRRAAVYPFWADSNFLVDNVCIKGIDENESPLNRYQGIFAGLSAIFGSRSGYIRRAISASQKPQLTNSNDKKKDGRYS
jgi:hypothetical protein